jgi:Domain of unknown function (DUF5658)
MTDLQKLLGFNLLLQIFDGVASYLILSNGEREVNPLVHAAIQAWGVGRALVYWKIFVCTLLVVLYSLKRFKTNLPRRGLTFAAIVYSVLGFYLVLHLMQV